MAKPRSHKPSKAPEKPAAGAGPRTSVTPSIDELRFRRAFQKSVTQRILSNTPLPEIPPPSLEGISVPLPHVLRQASDADLLERLGELAEDNVPRRPRSAQEVIQPGDELTLNIAGYCRGALIPFTFRREAILENRAGVFLPGFMEGLRGAKVGSIVQVRLLLPSNFGVEALRGLAAVFAVTILGAAEMLPVDVTSDSFLFGLGMGRSHQEVFDALEEEILSQWSADALSEAFDSVLTELARRSPPQVPQPLIDEELGRRWRRFEGDHLVALGVTAEERDAALTSWLENPSMRSEVEKMFARAQLLMAVGVGEKLQITREDLHEMISEGAMLAGVDLKQVARDLKEDPELNRRLLVEALTRKAAQHLIARCVANELA